MKLVTRISHSLYPSRGSSCGSAMSASCEQIAAYWRNGGRTKSSYEHLRSVAEKAKQSFVASALQRGCFFGNRHLEQIVNNSILRPEWSPIRRDFVCNSQTKIFWGF